MTSCEWMFGDKGLSGKSRLAHLNPMRWSGPISFRKAIADLEGTIQHTQRERAIIVKVPANSGKEQRFKSAQEAIDYLKSATEGATAAATEEATAAEQDVADVNERHALLEESAKLCSQEVTEATSKMPGKNGVEDEGNAFLDLCKSAAWPVVEERLKENPDLANWNCGGKHYSALYWAMYWANGEMLVKLVLMYRASPFLKSQGITILQHHEFHKDAKALDISNVKAKAHALELGFRLKVSKMPMQLPPQGGRAEVLPDLFLPEGFPVEDLQTKLFTTSIKTRSGESDPPTVEKFSFNAFEQLAKLIGKKKTPELFKELAEKLNLLLPPSPRRDEDKLFKAFLDNFEKFTVPRGIQIHFGNPFFASDISMQSRRFFEHYGIGVHKPEDQVPEGVNLVAEDGGLVITNLPARPGGFPRTFFQRFTECMDREKYPRFCVDVSKEPNALPSASFFKMSADGKHSRINDLTDEQKSDIVDTTGLWYAEAVHACLHVFHYLMVGMLVSVAEKVDSPDLKQLAEMYTPNVATKYNQIQKLLIGAEGFDGVLTTSVFQSDAHRLKRVMSDYVSNLGCCSGWKEVLELFYPQVWDASISSKLRGKTVDPAIPVVLKDLADQAELIGDFADRLSKQVDPKGLASKHMTTFCEGTGSERFRVTSLKQWLELMAITGMVHGCTFSMTRLFFLPQGLTYVGALPGTTPERFGEAFSQMDFETVAVALATIVGLEPDHAVFRGQKRGSSEEIGTILNDAHTESQAKKRRCRRHYEEKLGTDFNDFGWMFSDYFDDGGAEFPRFQSTLTTYV